MLSKRKRTMIERRLAADPVATNRALAKEFLVDHKTIVVIRASLGNGEIPRKKPARAKAKAPGPNAPPESDAQLPADDPVVIPRAIASDVSAPATTRVQAARTLLALQRPSAEEKTIERVDQVTQRALQLVDRGKT
jgi:hypothetical protein